MEFDFTNSRKISNNPKEDGENENLDAFAANMSEKDVNQIRVLLMI